MTLTTATPLCLVLLLVMIPGTISAETPRQAPYQHIRTSDARLRRLVKDGVRTSDTFRALVDRLHRSDVVVYLECDGATQRGGRLIFVSAAGGYRYVQVRMARLQSPDEQIALLAHELQHAVEIADAPQIVDDVSLAVEYSRIGYTSRSASGGRVSFDSAAAVQAGYRVLREMGGVMGD